jgi:hypothetical protein
MAQQRHPFGRVGSLYIGRHLTVWRVVHHAHQVLFFHLAVFANELARNATVLRQHQQSYRVNVEAPGRCQALQLTEVEARAAGVVLPVRARVDECHSGLMPVFGLTTDKTHGFVQQDGDLLLLFTLGLLGHLDHVSRFDQHAHFGHHAIHGDPAALDPRIAFPAGTHAQLGHALVQTRTVWRFVRSLFGTDAHGCRWLARRVERADGRWR